MQNQFQKHKRLKSANTGEAFLSLFHRKDTKENLINFTWKHTKTERVTGRNTNAHLASKCKCMHKHSQAADACSCCLQHGQITKVTALKLIYKAVLISVTVCVCMTVMYFFHIFLKFSSCIQNDAFKNK